MSSDVPQRKQDNRGGRRSLHDDEMQSQKWPGRKGTK